MMKKLLALLIAGTMFLTGCQSEPTEKPVETQSETKTEASVEPEEPASAQVKIFTDSAGREVEIPAKIDKVAVTGVPAQLVLFSICPDEMVGLARDFTDGNKMYLNEKYQNMEVFGQFYGKNANLNLEALLKADPDIIIDIGEKKDSIVEDMNGIQEQIGIPTVFIEAGIENYDHTYELLGQLLDREEEAKILAQYAAETIAQAKKSSSELKEKKSVYMALGENGLSTNAKGSYHAQILDLVGAENAADVQKNSKGGGTEVSLEQLLLWNPDVIITYDEDTYQMILSDAGWANLDAVKNKQVYKVPTEPFNFVSDPPSVNRLIGIHWLGHLLYPEQYEFSAEKMIEFSDLFYHSELTSEDAEAILLHAMAE